MTGAKGRRGVLRALPAGMRARGAPPPPRVALAAIVGLFIAVTVLRWFVDRSGQAAALLYVVPIALSGLWYGRRGGAGAAGLGAVAFAVLAAVHGQGDLDLTGWVGPVVAMGLVGGLVGHLAEHAANRDRAAARHASRRRHLEEVCEAQRAALAASDSIVQDVAAARWMLEAGHTEEAMDVLGGTVADGISRLSEARSVEATGSGRAGDEPQHRESSEPEPGGSGGVLPPP